jgi:PST family polysaccharide transporter/teichuronic acid exporter
MDIIMVGKIFGSEILGGYSLAKELVNRPLKVSKPIISRVATPVLSKLQQEKSRLKSNFLKLLNIVSSVNIPIYILIILTAPLLVNILYGTDFKEIYPLVRILAIYQIFVTLYDPCNSLIIATGRTDIVLKWNIIMVMVVPLMIFIGAQFSIEGVAAAQVMAMVILFVPGWWIMVWSILGIDLRTYTAWIIPNIRLWNLKKLR